MYSRAWIVLTLVVTLLAIPSLAISEIAFTDASGALNNSYSGASFGGGWGDLDGDGLPDLFVGNHADALPSLYLNNGDGTFTDVGAQQFGSYLGDPHGVAWADFDNDGDEDLYEIHGGCCNNRLYVNDGGSLTDRAVVSGAAYQGGRGRTPVWIDADRDGLLDLALAVANGPGFPTTIFQQLPNASFVDRGVAWGISLATATWAQISDQDGDGLSELIFSSLTGPFRLNSTTTIPLPNVTSMHPIPTASNVLDTAMGDFDGDLVSDFFYARVAVGFELAQIDDHTIVARLMTSAEEQPFTFQTTGTISVEVGPGWRVGPSLIFIGSSGVHPAAISFDLDPTDSNNSGLVPHEAGGITGVVIGVDPMTNTWTVAQNSPSASYYLEYRIRSTAPITNLDVTWNRNYVPTVGMRSVLHTPTGGYVTNDNLATPSACVSATAADFDNDMDLDVFMSCSGPASNYDNLLFENDGSGNFTAVPGAGGAAGSPLGRSDLALSADYDLDGFVDVFVANGRGDPPLDEGPHELFRNNGGLNHWIQIDLEGTQSNRNGIGAKILLESGGVVQLREQGGGMHSFAQDFKRIHFGLGSNTVADRIIVRWPSGIEQIIEQVPADQVIRIVETAAGVPSLRLSNGIAALLVALLMATGISRLKPRFTKQTCASRP